MKLSFTPEQEAFRAEAARWLTSQMDGPFADIRAEATLSGKLERRLDWERALGKAGWSAIGWPQQYGGRAASLAEQVIFAEEYVRAGAPGRVGHIGVELAGPTLLHFGTQAQKDRFLRPIILGEEFWAQGYSEPNAGSDLSNVRTRAWLEDGPNGPEWVIEGQKIWTSFAGHADWIFVLVRTEPGSQGPKGLSFLLAPMRQPGITVRPIRQMSGEADFNETFFDGARTAHDNIVGAPGDGWKVAMGLLSFERGVGALAQQMSFQMEFEALVRAARANGALEDRVVRLRLAEAYAGLKVMRYRSLRSLSEHDNSRMEQAALSYKLYWATWHRNFGELAMDILGAEGELAPGAAYAFPPLTHMFLQSRSDTIYGGANQIQRNIIAERGLGLPREPRG